MSTFRVDVLEGARIALFSLKANRMRTVRLERGFIVSDEDGVKAARRMAV